MEKYLTLDNLAQIFNASLTTLRKRIKEGVLIPYQKTDKGYLFDPKEIKKLNKTDIVRKFKLPSGYRRNVVPPTKRELNLLRKYVLDADRTKIAEKMGISRQRLHQKATTIAYRKACFEIINEQN